LGETSSRILIFEELRANFLKLLGKHPPGDSK